MLQGPNLHRCARGVIVFSEDKMNHFLKTNLYLALFLMFAALSGCSEDKGLRITSISPKTGPHNGGGTVTIHGNGFKEASSLGVKIYFNKREAKFLRFDGDTKMMIQPPSGTLGEKVNILITFGDGREHTFPEAFTYVDPKAGFDLEALAPSK